MSILEKIYLFLFGHLLTRFDEQLQLISEFGLIYELSCVYT